MRKTKAKNLGKLPQNDKPNQVVTTIIRLGKSVKTTRFHISSPDEIDFVKLFLNPS